MNRTIALILLIATLAHAALAGEKSSGVFIGEVTDKDGDEQILMESKWISMHLMPSESMTIMRFVFRPTGNDILQDVQPKFLRAGGGLFQDNLWEQDWRFQELRSRYYDYKILERGPDEVKIVFQTKTIGYLGYVNSGIISRLLSNIIIRRTVTLKANTPFFRVDVELINDDPGGYAKLPMYWLHNSSIISAELGDQVHRPSARGVRTVGGDRPSEEHYIWDFNKGWTARMSRGKKEGIVYLVDYDYILHFYNCYTTTTEWMYDNILILKNRPWKGRVYIIPVMGLTRVDYANRYFVAQVEPRRTKNNLSIDYALASSYEKARKVSFNTTIEYDQLKGKPKKLEGLPTVEVEDIGLEPRRASVQVPNLPDDPFVVSTTAYVELPNGEQRKFLFQTFHVGNYGYGDNIRKDLKTPVAVLERDKQKPFVPVPETNQKINRKDWNVFGLIGCNSRMYHYEDAVKLLGGHLDRGDCPGFQVAQNGLTDFPYDYDRLFNYRVLLYSNCNEQILRRIGASILVKYLERGGGLCFLGGDSAFTTGIDNHEFAHYLPFKAKNPSIKRGVLRLNTPKAGHPIFKGVDLSNLPYCQYYHDLQLNPDMQNNVLLKVGDHPFIVESRYKNSRIMTVLCVPFENLDAMPGGKQHYLGWSEWPKLLANVIHYAGQ